MRRAAQVHRRRRCRRPLRRYGMEVPSGSSARTRWWGTPPAPPAWRCCSGTASRSASRFSNRSAASTPRRSVIAACSDIDAKPLARWLREGEVGYLGCGGVPQAGNGEEETQRLRAGVEAKQTCAAPPASPVKAPFERAYPRGQFILGREPCSADSSSVACSWRFHWPRRRRCPRRISPNLPRTPRTTSSSPPAVNTATPGAGRAPTARAWRARASICAARCSSSTRTAGPATTACRCRWKCAA